jgi:hypothetical protein
MHKTTIALTSLGVGAGMYFADQQEGRCRRARLRDRRVTSRGVPLGRAMPCVRESHHDGSRS